MDQTFGQAFGALIREKRGQEGLTQLELAVQAFNDESKVRRIIAIEKGEVRRPQAKTIDPLRACLGITREEIAACERHAAFTEAEVRSIGLTRQLLEGLALRFEHDNPDAPDVELLAFLQEKARELRELRGRLSGIEANSESLKLSLSEANRAIDEGRFEEADDLLAEAEDAHESETTLKAIDAQADIRASRGDTSLFRGDREKALHHYVKAAEYAVNFDKRLVVGRLVEYAGRIYELQRRSWNPQFSQAIVLIDKAIRHLGELGERAATIDVYYCSALLRQTEAKLPSKKVERAKLLNEAIDHCSIAVAEVGTAEEFDWARCTFLLANCFLARSEIAGKSSAIDLAKAIELYERYLSAPRTTVLDAHRAAVLNSLATAQRYARSAVTGEQRDELNRRIKGNLRRAIDLSADSDMPDVWSAALSNLASELHDEIPRSEPSKRGFLLVQAIAACQASVEAYPQTAFSTQVANTNLLLGRLLIDAALNMQGEMRRVYFARAQGVLEGSRLVFEEGANPTSLAHVRFYLAFLATEYAELFPEESGAALDAAQHHLSGALETVGLNKDFKQKCERLLTRVVTLLAVRDRQS